MLTPAEWRVLEELRAGGTYVEVAVRLGLQVGTVKFHARNMREKLHLETREQLVAWRHEREAGERRGALAPLALFTGYLQPALLTAAVVVVSAAAIAAGVLAYTVVNSGEPMDSPATTAMREEGGDATGSASSASPTPTASPVAPSPTPSPVAPSPTPSPVAPSPTPSASDSPEDVPAIHFWGDIPESQQVAIRARTTSIVEFFEARYGVRVPDLEVHVGADEAAMDDATRSAEGARAWVGFAQYRNGTLFLRMDVSAHAIEHLYFHAIQDYLSQGRDLGPWWLNEGAAVYAEYLFRDARGERTLDEAMDFARWSSSYSSVRLDELETDSPTASESFDRNDSLAALAVGWLIQQGGEDSLIAYYRQRPRSQGWTEAFEVAFGVPFSEVYSAFAAYRAETVAVRRNVSGVVLGPDGKPVEDWRVDIEAFPESAQGQFHLREDATAEDFNGDFTSRLPDGTYELALVTRCPGGWVDLGWYGGESGFTASIEDATHVVVEGEDIDGLVIRLPALPDEMFPERCSYGPRVAVSGVVIGLDGQPRSNIHLTSHDPVSGIWPDNTVSAANGSFTLSLPENGTYEIWAAKVCEHEGRYTPIVGEEHGIAGDVQLDADGLLEAGKEDIGGVIIQLRDAFTCSPS